MKLLWKITICIFSLLIFTNLITACALGTSAEEYVDKGLANYEDGNLEQAIEDYTQAIELDPNLVEAYFNRGIAYQTSDNREQAIADYTKTIELDPNYKEAYFNRGGNYGILGYPEQAIEDYTQAIKVDPTYAIAYRNRGYAYAKSILELAVIQSPIDSDDYTQAIADFERYLELAPNAPDREKVVDTINSVNFGHGSNQGTGSVEWDDF